MEKGAFHVETSFLINDELIRKEYEPWGLTAEPGNTLWNYKGETIRTYQDKMVGSVQTCSEGTVDVFVQRNDCGEITSVDVFHEGNPEYDERTRKRERGQNRQSYYGMGNSAITNGTAKQTEIVVTEGYK